MRRRAVLCLQYVTSQLEMLNQMSPWEYSEIRVVLGHGSGFDSPGFRRVPAVTQRVGKAFDRLLERAGCRSRSSTCADASTRSSTSWPSS